jgi:hypothetical protein
VDRLPEGDKVAEDPFFEVAVSDHVYDVGSRLVEMVVEPASP